LPTITSGDAARLEALYSEHHDQLLRFAVVVASGDREDAEELVQEAFVRLGRAASWPAAGAEAAYLRSTVLNLNRGLIRRLSLRRRRTVPADDTTRHDHVEASAVASEGQGRILAEIRALPLRQAECVALHYLVDLPDTEVASTLGISVGAVKSHLARARSTLATKLGDLR